MHAAVTSVNVPIVVGVTDRLGNVLGVFDTENAPATGAGNFGTMPDANNLAVALARTGAFFSNNAAPLSSRTVRYISGIHFPPGVAGTANAALYGIENTNRGCSFNTTFLPGQAIPPATMLGSSAPGLGIITGKADVEDSEPFAVNPGGVPLFENGTLVGGVGVVVSPDVLVRDGYCRVRSVHGSDWSRIRPDSCPARRRGDQWHHPAIRESNHSARRGHGRNF